MAWFTASVTARVVMVAPVMASTWPSWGVWYLMTSKPPSGAACWYCWRKSSFSALAPRPGVSSWARITTPVTLPSLSMPVITETAPP